jgi:hypothetical protein
MNSHSLTAKSIGGHKFIQSLSSKSPATNSVVTLGSVNSKVCVDPQWEARILIGCNVYVIEVYLDDQGRPGAQIIADLTFQCTRRSSRKLSR